MDTKGIFAFLAMAIGTISSLIYVVSVLKRQVKPHAFSWFVWGSLFMIAAAIQIVSHAGAGAWATAYTGAMCLGIAGLAIPYGEKNITRSDWIALGLAFLALPLWLLASSPLLAVCWMTFINQAGVYPTFRKGWNDPWREHAFVFFLGGMNAALSVVAIEAYSLETTLYPSVVAVSSLSIAIMLWVRRRKVAEG